jgi:hypothetical protein
MKTQADRNARKFAEPRSWAAKWCGHGLTTGRNRPQALSPMGKTFAEPRGWSAKWCGGGLGLRRHGVGTRRPTD